MSQFGQINPLKNQKIEVLLGIISSILFIVLWLCLYYWLTNSVLKWIMISCCILSTIVLLTGIFGYFSIRTPRVNMAYA